MITDKEASEMSKNLRLTLKELRKEKNLYISTVSKLIGVCDNTLLALERRSHRRYSLETLIKYADLVGMELKLVPKEKNNNVSN